MKYVCVRFFRCQGFQTFLQPLIAARLASEVAIVSAADIEIIISSSFITILSRSIWRMRCHDAIIHAYLII